MEQKRKIRPQMTAVGTMKTRLPASDESSSSSTAVPSSSWNGLVNPVIIFGASPLGFQLMDSPRVATTRREDQFPGRK